MKSHSTKTSLFAFLFAVISATTAVSAANASVTPVLSLVSESNSTVGITVAADPNAPVQLYYGNQYPSTGQNVGVIGYTASNGYLSATASDAQYNIPPNGYVYVMVDGIASAPVQWPYYANTSGSYTYPGSYQYGSTQTAITFSQNNIALAQGQTTTVTIYGGSSYYYISQTSPDATAVVNGNVLTLTGIAGGSATISVCSTSATSCGTLSLTVTGPSYPYQQYPQQYQYPATYAYPISLVPGTVNITTGQSATVSISGGGGYFVYSNSDSSAVSATVSGNALYVSALSPGSSSILVCESAGSNCTTLYVTVNPAVTYNYAPTYPQYNTAYAPTYTTTYVAPQPVYVPPPQPVYVPAPQPIYYPIVRYVVQPVQHFFSYAWRNWR